MFNCFIFSFSISIHYIGIVNPCFSDYASPIVLADKKDGSKRICIDFRRLNSKIVKDRYPLPVIEDQIQKLNSAKVFCTIDLRNGFFHVPVENSSRKYTAFVTQSGTYEFTRAPFGLCNSPAVFQRFINCIFHEMIKEKVVLAYMDDLIIPGQSETECLKNLKDVLKLSSEYGLEINWKKCQFLTTKVEYLGTIIENGKITPSECKIKAVKKMKIPTNVKELQRFLGLTGYFRKYIENYALIAKPLTNVLRNNDDFKMGSEQIEAINELKRLLSTKPVLNMFQHGKETELHTDASKDGLAAILLQKNYEDLHLHPVYYLSKKTTEAEEKLTSYELEVLAVVHALKRLRLFLIGIPFKIVTDCSAFQMTMNKKDISPKIARWALMLTDFKYTIEHRSGEKMKHVDALSRAPIVATITSKIRNSQVKDDILKTVIEMIQKHGSHNDFLLDNGILYKEENGKNVLVIPKGMQAEIIRKIHEDGHFGFKKMEELIKRDYFIPSLKQKIENCIQNCIQCILGKRKSGKQEGFLHSIPKGDVPLETIHLDHIGPMQATKKQYKHCLVMTDAFTKFTWMYPVKGTTAEETVNKLKHQETTFGNPSRFIVDRGAAFRSNLFKEYCETKHIEFSFTTTGIARANGQVERQNETIKSALIKLSSDKPDEWFKHVSQLQRALNSSVQRSIKMSPFEALVGIPMKTEICPNFTEIIDHEKREAFNEYRENLRESAKKGIMKIQNENKKYFDAKRKPAQSYKTNELVAIKRTQFLPGLKLHSLYLGPYRITNVRPNERYDVEKVGHHEGPIVTSSAADFMKPWSGGVETNDESSDDEKEDT